ncbi:MAG: lipoprotein-releasing ABC transporter permease subunit [Gammaproteobacteria bacterium]|nr:lipoprotein-releasing ABC transporter permease subunit [Gammaproteobacteria bacterium]
MARTFIVCASLVGGLFGIAGSARYTPAGMFTPIESFIAWRYTRSRRRTHLVSFIAATSISGVALGIMALITILSIMNGFEREMRERLLGMTAHLEINSTAKTPQDWSSIGAEVEALEAVAAWAPYIEGQAMLAEAGNVQGVAVHGIEPAREANVSVLAARMQIGQLEALAPGRFNVIIGRGLADSLRLTPGDDVTLILAEPLRTATGMLPRLKRFHVVGIFEAGVQEYDTASVFIHLDDAARMFRRAGAQGLHITLHDPFAIAAARGAILQRPGAQNLVVQDWTTRHASLFRALETEKIVMFVILLLSVGVAAFNLVSTLVMVVAEKHTEIAILQTLGMTPPRILRIFFTQGALIGLTGVVVGGTAGIWLARHIENVIAWIEEAFHFKILAPDVYYISHIPAQLEATDVFVTLGCAVVLCLIAPLYPAWIASRTRPAEALRYE